MSRYESRSVAIASRDESRSRFALGHDGSQSRLERAPNGADYGFVAIDPDLVAIGPDSWSRSQMIATRDRYPSKLIATHRQPRGTDRDSQIGGWLLRQAQFQRDFLKDTRGGPRDGRGGGAAAPVPPARGPPSRISLKFVQDAEHKLEDFANTAHIRKG